MKGKRLKTLDIAVVPLFTALLCVSAWITIPFGAVPVTLQTFTVYVAAAVLGAKRSTIAVLLYLAIGMTGLPVFSGFCGGAAVLAGPTGGYLTGFVLMCIASGLIIEKYSCKTAAMTAAFFIGTLLCYAVGTLWYVFIYLGGTGFSGVITTCVLPFIIPDAVKIVLAAAVAGKLKERVKI